jgi:hypothetical protein
MRHTAKVPTTEKGQGHTAEVVPSTEQYVFTTTTQQKRYIFSTVRKLGLRRFSHNYHIGVTLLTRSLMTSLLPQANSSLRESLWPCCSLVPSLTHSYALSPHLSLHSIVDLQQSVTHSRHAHMVCPLVSSDIFGKKSMLDSHCRRL